MDFILYTEQLNYPTRRGMEKSLLCILYITPQIKAEYDDNYIYCKVGGEGEKRWLWATEVCFFIYDRSLFCDVEVEGYTPIY
jgi:hypothetical protein